MIQRWASFVVFRSIHQIALVHDHRFQAVIYLGSPSEPSAVKKPPRRVISGSLTGRVPSSLSSQICCASTHAEK